MPLTLDSTRALRGEKRKWTLVVMGHGRWHYLNRTLSSIVPLLGMFDRKVFSLDGPVPGGSGKGPDCAVMGINGWDVRATGSRHGLTANLAQALGALTTDDEWVFWLEEDFLVLDAPLDDMADSLEANRDLAQMALVRQPWSAEEFAAGGLLHGPHLQGDLRDGGGWLRQKRIFTLNPFVAHASLLRSLTPGVETSLTEQCLERGLSFGYWGGMEDEPRVLHIGAENGMGSPGWKP